MNLIEIRDLNIKINSGELVCVVGPTLSGKTKLINKISGRIKNSDIYIDNKNIKSYSLDYKRHNIVCVFNDNLYNTNNYISELSYYLKKLNYSTSEIKSRIDKFISYFDLDIYNNIKIEDMRVNDAYFIKILSLLIINPSIFCIDDLLTYLDKKNIIKILNYIKDNKITLISVISNMEEAILFDKILLLNNGVNMLYSDIRSAFNNEKIFKDLGLNIPFIYDINNMLKSYDLINEDHLVYKELIDILWK